MTLSPSPREFEICRSTHPCPGSKMSSVSLCFVSRSSTLGIWQAVTVITINGRQRCLISRAIVLTAPLLHCSHAAEMPTPSRKSRYGSHEVTVRQTEWLEAPRCFSSFHFTDSSVSFSVSFSCFWVSVGEQTGLAVVLWKPIALSHASGQRVKCLPSFLQISSAHGDFRWAFPPILLRLAS